MLVYAMCSLSGLYFFCLYKPMKTPFSNFLENLNEVFVLLTTYTFIIFSEFIPEVEFRYQLGYAYCILLGTIIGVNIISVFVPILHSGRQNFREARYNYKIKNVIK